MGCNSYLTGLAFLIALGIIELGLVVANFEGTEKEFFEQDYPNGDINLLRPATILVIVSAVWNGTLGIVYCLSTAGRGTSALLSRIPAAIISIWALLTSVLWCTSGILFYKAHGAVECGGLKGPVNCQITIAGEVVAWANFVLSLILAGLAVWWIIKGSRAASDDEDAGRKPVQMDSFVG
ncbi:hypothetical protein FRC15_007774 [Serendipita sp. 397]|nr:hypothetical protein FRC15_007774 [Serendipita sp. 397]